MKIRVATESVHFYIVRVLVKNTSVSSYTDKKTGNKGMNRRFLFIEDVKRIPKWYVTTLYHEN